MTSASSAGADRRLTSIEVTTRAPAPSGVAAPTTGVPAGCAASWTAGAAVGCATSVATVCAATVVSPPSRPRARKTRTRVRSASACSQAIPEYADCPRSWRPTASSFALGARFDWAADVAACDRGGGIGVIDPNVDCVLGAEEIGERRVDDRRAELGRNRGERALRGFSRFVPFDGADVDELEGRLRAKAAAAAGVDPGRQRLAWLDEPADARERDGLRRRNGRGPWSGCWLASCRLAYQLPGRADRRSPRGAQPPFRQTSPAAQSAPLVQPALPTAGWTGTGPPSKAWATPGATPTAASMASPRKTRRRLARCAPDVIATVSASNLRAFMLSCSLNCGAIWRLCRKRHVDDCDDRGTGLTGRHHWRPRVKDPLSRCCD